MSDTFPSQMPKSPAVTPEQFFLGRDADARAPGLWTLVLSQVTTWIFARSLMNAAILGYYYGVAGVLAYAAYYLSFLTGGYWVGRLRGAGAGSVQDWLGGQFPISGRAVYNLLVGLRLISEVFANLLVIGLIATAILPGTPGVAGWTIAGFAALALSYSAYGGMHASLRSDVWQMVGFLIVFALAFGALILGPEFSWHAVLRAPGTAGPVPGWLLIAVAGLQVLAYPLHDPVMMDRGFLADARTTRQSFLHAFWISTLCILGFGLFGIQAGLIGAPVESQLIGTWATMFPPWIFAALILSLMISALSTLDSALASAARLVVWEARLPRTVPMGRLVMAGFAVAGLALTLWGNQSLFDAVAVSGTAALFLAPVCITALSLGQPLREGSYLGAALIAFAGAALYVLRDTGLGQAVLPEAHKYAQLLIISAMVLGLGGLICLLDALRGAGRSDAAAR